MKRMSRDVRAIRAGLAQDGRKLDFHLELFPLAGRVLTGALGGRQVPDRPVAVVVLLYVHDADDDVVYLVAVHDGSSSTSATHERP
jgi:hypothetical protein